MKYFKLILLLLFISIGVNAQTKVTAPLVRNSSADMSYGTHYDSLGYGGLVTFSTIANRNAFPTALRKRGMVATIKDSIGILWQLQGGVTNSDWYRFAVENSANSITALFRVLGTDSVYGVINGLPYYQFKDSVGSESSGSTDTTKSAYPLYVRTKAETGSLYDSLKITYGDSIIIGGHITGSNLVLEKIDGDSIVISGIGTGSDTVIVDSPLVIKIGIGLAKDTVAMIQAPAYSILGNNTGVEVRASYFTNKYGDSLKISNDTIYMRVNAAWVYQLRVPGIDTTFYKATANNLGVTSVENKGFYATNNTASTNTGFQYSPPLIFEGQSWSNILAASQSSKFRMYNKTASGIPSNGFGSNLVIEYSAGGAAYTTPFIFSAAGNFTNLGTISSTGFISSSSNIGALYFTGVWSNGPSTTRTIYNAGGNIATGYQSNYRGFNYEPTVSSSLGVTLTAFRNTVGNNILNATSGSTGIGVTTTIDGGAKLEINSTTQGLLLPRMTKAQRDRITSTFTGTVAAGTGYTTTAGNTVSLTGGSGTGAQANVTVTAGAVTVTSIFSFGTGYLIGDVLTISAAGGTGATYTITATAVTEGMIIYQTDNTPGLRVYNGTNWMKFTETAD